MFPWLRLRLFGAGSPSPPEAGTKACCDAATQTDGELLLLLLRQSAVRERKMVFGFFF